MTIITHPPSYFHTSGKISSRKAAADLWEGLQRAPLWLSLSWQEIKIRYRGSMLGPFWLSISMAVTVGALSFVYGALFKIPLDEYVPYLAAGMMVWGLISTLLGEACICFSAAENLIKKVRQPFSIYVYRTVWRNLIVFAHNIVIFLAVMLIFGLAPNLNTLLAFPGMALIIVNAIWVCFLFGMVCARFRDITQIVNSFVQMIFFITPIFWRPSSLGGNQSVVYWNPFYHMVELVRAPLLGHAPTPENWLVGLGFALVGGIVSFLFFRRFRSRLTYWV